MTRPPEHSIYAARPRLKNLCVKIVYTLAGRHGRGKVLSLFPNWLVRRLNRTRHPGRIGNRGGIGIAFRGLPRQTREQAKGPTKSDAPLRSRERFSPFFVEDVECG